jgi:uracil-DNA glycosylase family 4
MRKPEACKGCPFFDDGEGFVPDEIYPGARLTFIAQNPGETEETLKRPMIGRTGQLIMGDIGRYGFDRKDCSWMNVIKCRCRDETGKKGNKLPVDARTDKAADWCIREHMKVPESNVYALLGDVALQYMTGITGIDSWRGSVWVQAQGLLAGKKVMALIHPAAIFRDLSWRAAHKQDFARLAREAHTLSPSVQYNDLFYTGVSADEFINFISSSKGVLALDVETSYAKPIDATLKVIGVASSREVAANYTYRRDDGDDRRVCDALSAYNGQYVTATPFDYIVLKKEGVTFQWENCHDLTLLHSRFDIELPHTLEYIASMFTNRPFWKWMAPTDLLRYNCLDCVGEYESFERLAEYCRFKDPQVWNVYERDRLLIPVVVDLHLNGFPTSLELIKEEREWYAKRLKEKREELMEVFKPKVMDKPAPCEKHPRYTGKTPVKMRKGEEVLCHVCQGIADWCYGSRPVNLNSRKQLMEILKGEGMEMLKDRETKKESLAKGKVADLFKKYSDPKLLKLLSFWEDATVISRYFKDAWVSKRTGRIHPQYAMHAAKHRWSCSKPNCQQLKKPEREVIDVPDK